MKLAIEIIKKEIAQRKLANKHNHLRKDEINKELESLDNVVNFISSNPVLADVNPLKDFLLGLRFAEHPEIRKEAQRLLGIYFC